MADAIFRMKFDTVPEWGEEGEYDLTRLSRGQLSHFKGWFGPEYGQRLTVLSKSFVEDGDAVSCLVWACRKENGLDVREPRLMPDFDPSEVFVRVARKPCPTCEGTGIDPESFEGDAAPLETKSSPDTKTSPSNGLTEEIQTNSGTDG